MFDERMLFIDERQGFGQKINLQVKEYSYNFAKIKQFNYAKRETGRRSGKRKGEVL